MTDKSKQPKTAKNRPRKGARKPHNAKVRGTYESVDELVEAIGSETQRTPFGGAAVLMTRRERAYRRMIQSALEGNTRELRLILKLMSKYPELGCNVRVQYWFGGLV